MKALTPLEKILLTIVGFLVAAWLGWLTTTVLSVHDTEDDINNFRDWNIKQEDAIKALDKRIDKYHTTPRTH